LNGLEEQRRSGVERLNIGAGQAVLQAEASERKAPGGVASENSEAGAVLRVVLNELRVDADGLLRQERFLLGLIKVVAAGEDGEARGDWTIEQVRLGKAKHERAGEIAELRRKGQSLAKAEEVVVW